MASAWRGTCAQGLCRLGCIQTAPPCVSLPAPRSLQAPTFPRMEVLLPNGSPATFPPAATAFGSGSSSTGGSSSSELEPAAASLVCLAFRAGAQPMLEAWASGFSVQLQGCSGVALYELAIVEGVVSRSGGSHSACLPALAAAPSSSHGRLPGQLGISPWHAWLHGLHSATMSGEQVPTRHPLPPRSAPCL